MSTHIRSRFAIRISTTLLALGLLCFGGSASASDSYSVKGQISTVTEDSTHIVSSQRIETTQEPIVLGRDETSLVLGTKSITDKTTGVTSNYRTEVFRKDASLTLAVTDLETGRLEEYLFPTAGPGCFPAGTFDSLNACIKTFNCDKGAELLCKANQSCRPQFAALTCCLKDGSAFSVHLVIKPTSFKCRLLDHAVDLEGLVLSRK